MYVITWSGGCEIVSEEELYGFLRDLLAEGATSLSYRRAN